MASKKPKRIFVAMPGRGKSTGIALYETVEDQRRRIEDALKELPSGERLKAIEDGSTSQSDNP